MSPWLYTSTTEFYQPESHYLRPESHYPALTLNPPDSAPNCNEGGLRLLHKRTDTRAYPPGGPQVLGAGLVVKG